MEEAGQVESNMNNPYAAAPVKKKSHKALWIIFGVVFLLVVIGFFLAPLFISTTVIPDIQEEADKGLACLDAESGLEIVQGSNTCTDSEKTSVEIKRWAGSGNIVEINVQLQIGGETYTEALSSAYPLPGEVESVVYVSDIYVEAQTASITPLIEVDGKTIQCGASIPTELPAC